MSLLEKQNQHWAHHSDQPVQETGSGGITGSVKPGVSVPSSSSEPRTSRGENKTSDSRDPGEGEINSTGKYARYADEPPDGGLKAWSVVLAAALTTCATFGYASAWGIFQAYYEEVILSHDSQSNIAWIGSTQYALVFLPGPVAGRLFDLGYFKIPYFFASCLLIACTFLIAECKVYWHFFLAQGLGAGLACGILLGPALGVVSHWFLKRRGLALGLNAIGASVGGAVFPIAAQNLIPEVGFKWTVRIFGFFLLFFLGTAYLLIDRRLPPMNVKGGLFNWAALKNPAYTIFCISGTTTLLGLYTMLTYIAFSAVRVGVPNSLAFYFVAIANASSALGRISAGLLADRVGAINCMVPFIIVTAVVTIIWPFVTSEGTLIGISVIYGFSCGTYASLMCIPVMAMGSIGDVGRRTGMFLGVSALGVLGGPPISGAINSLTGGFEDVGLYAGGMLLSSVCLMLLARHLHLGKLTGKF